MRGFIDGACQRYTAIFVLFCRFANFVSRGQHLTDDEMKSYEDNSLMLLLTDDEDDDIYNATSSWSLRKLYSQKVRGKVGRTGKRDVTRSMNTRGPMLQDAARSDNFTETIT